MKAKRIFCLVVILLVGVGLFFLLDRWVFPKETYIHETHSARLVCADGTEVPCSVRITGLLVSRKTLLMQGEPSLRPAFRDGAKDGIFLNDRLIASSYLFASYPDSEFFFVGSKDTLYYLSPDAKILVIWLSDVRSFVPEQPEGSGYVVLSDNTEAQYAPLLEALKSQLGQ